MTARKHRSRWTAALCLLALAIAPVLADEAAPEPPPEGNLGTTSGAEIYAQVCQGCHMPDGKGAVGGGSYPAFAGNANMASSRYMAVVILGGRRNMPAFSPERTIGPYFEPVFLTDVQVANVINHIRTNFGNDYRDPITAAEVKALHPQKGTPE
ncbi:MAG: cytochrome c [Arenimonas sp.]|nr:cytochrome c [Arenimonas sp.]